MRIISLLFVLVTSICANSAMNLEPVLQKIRAHACAVALTGKPLLVVVGLGNFGYAGTRHNMGEETVNRLEQTAAAQSEDIPEHWEKYLAKDDADAERYMEFTAASSPIRDGLTIEYRVGGRVAIPSADSDFANIIFVHPYYDINESGHFVSHLANGLRIPPQQIVVVVDDLTLARNQVVLSVGKADGSGDGHNGLKSINLVMQNGSYYRLRIGISNPKAERLDVNRTDWVLGMIPESDSAIAFSADRLNEMLRLLKNIQARSAPDAHTQKLVGEGSATLKRINGQN